ncbi:hypothetical protein [Aphanothece hegewaldii]|uniref:hypothetical protein n=1 Tax=Aphanothece hegewaldii TaxID=1521625 RepID=UPI0015E6D0EC|nr:hypothetical protein [Aphanothece hegewaldii]
MLIATPQPWMTLAEARHYCTNYYEVLYLRSQRGYVIIYGVVKANRLVKEAL